MLNSIPRSLLLLLTVLFFGSFKHYANLVAPHFPQWNTELELVTDLIEVLRSILLLIPNIFLGFLIIAISQIATAVTRFTIFLSQIIDSPAPGWVTQILQSPHQAIMPICTSIFEFGFHINQVLFSKSPQTAILIFISMITYFVYHRTASPSRNLEAFNTPRKVQDSTTTAPQLDTQKSWFPWLHQQHLSSQHNTDDFTAVQLFHRPDIQPANYSLNHLNVHAGHTKFLLQLNTTLNGKAFNLPALIDALQHTAEPNHTLIRTISMFPLTITTWKEFVKHYFQTFYSKKSLHQMFTKYHQKFYRETITTPGELKDFVNRWKANSIYLLIEDIDEYFPFYLQFGPFSNLQFKKLLAKMYNNNIQEFIYLIGEAKSYSSLLGKTKKRKRKPQQLSSSIQAGQFTKTPPTSLSPHSYNNHVTTSPSETLPTVETTNHKTKTPNNSTICTGQLTVYSMTNFVLADNFSSPETRDTTPNRNHSKLKPPDLSSTCVVDDSSTISEHITPAPGPHLKQLQQNNVHTVRSKSKLEYHSYDKTLQNTFIEPDDVHIADVDAYCNPINLPAIADKAVKPIYLKRESPHYTSELKPINTESNAPEFSSSKPTTNRSALPQTTTYLNHKSLRLMGRLQY